jgi:hypothetical protein
MAISRELTGVAGSDPRIPGYPYTTLFFVRGSKSSKTMDLANSPVFLIITCCFPKGDVA